MKPEEIEILIGLYLKGEADGVQRQQLESWLTAGDANRKVFEEYREVWERTDGLRRDEPVDTEAAWKKFEVIRERQSGPDRAGVRSLRWWIRSAAAVLVLGMGIGYAYYFSGSGVSEVAIVTGRERQFEQRLPDGTLVWLNSHSKLTYPEKFSGNTRTVSLEGEAFFDVTKDTALPFIIEANGVAIRVLGTSFNVLTSRDSTQVSVMTGKVSVADRQNSDNNIRLEPGQEGVFRQFSTQLLIRKIKDPNILAWKTGRLIFEDVSLGTVLKTISDYYQIPITLTDGGAARCRINTVFNNQPLEEVLDEITLLLDVQVEQSPQKIIVSGQGCKKVY